MSKFEIQASVIEQTIEELENSKNITSEEQNFIQSIRAYVSSILDWKEFLTFETKRDIHEILCDKIDEELVYHPDLSEEFKEKLEDLRVKGYLDMRTIRNRKEDIISDHFLHKNTNRLVKTSTILWKDIDFSLELTMEYFNNPENLRYDLQQFANKTETKSILNINSSNLPRTTLSKIRNNSNISWWKYLSKASNFLLWTGYNDVKHWQALDELKYILWIKEKVTEELSKEYFQNPENLRYDLQQFADKIYSKNIIDIGINNPERNIIVTIKNWQSISWMAYLNNASKFLLWTVLNSENWHRPWKALDELKYILLIKEKITEELSAEYFQNPENVIHDLQQFANQREDKNFSKLSIDNPNLDVKVKLKNLQYISWRAYLNNASVYLLWTVSSYRGNLPFKHWYKIWSALSKLFEIIWVEREIDKVRKKSALLEEILSNTESEKHKEMEKVFKATWSFALLYKFLEEKYWKIFENEYEAQITLRNLLWESKLWTIIWLEKIPDLFSVPYFQSIEELLDNDLIYDYFKERYINYLFSNVEKNDLTFFSKINNEISKLNDGIVKTLITEVMTYYNELLILDAPEVFKPDVKDSNFKTRKFPSLHQKLAMMKLWEEDRILVAEWTWSGKTLTSMLAREYCKTLEKFDWKAPKTLVICPSSAIKDVWMPRISKYYKEENRPTAQVLWEKVLSSENFQLHDYNIISYKNLTLNVIYKLKELWIEYIIIDESQNLKNYKWKWNHYVDILINHYESKLQEKWKKLQLMKLSATPITNHVTEDIHYIFKFLWLLEEWVDWVANILRTKPSFIKDVFSKKVLRHNREDILVELPSVKDKLEELDLWENEQKLYDFILKLSDIFHPMKILNYLQLISINPKYVLNILKNEISWVYSKELEELEKLEFENTKLNLLKSIINQKIGDEQKKILIFTSNITEWILKRGKIEKEDIILELIEQKLTFEEIELEYRARWFEVIFIDQSVSMSEREKIMKAEHKNPKKKTILFLTWWTSWEAIDASFAHTSIKLNPAWTASEEEQIIWRMHRPWQKNESEFIRLLVWKLDKAINRYANWKNEKIKKLLDDWEALNIEELDLLDWKDKVKTIKEFVKKVNREKFEWMEIMVNNLCRHNDKLSLKIWEWQSAIKKTNWFHKKTEWKNISNWYNWIIDEHSYSYKNLEISDHFSWLINDFKQDPNDIFNKMIEYVIRDLLQRKLKDRLSSLYEKDRKNFWDKRVSVKITSDYDDVRSWIDLILSFEWDKKEKNKYIWIDVAISWNEDYLVEKSIRRDSIPTEFNLSKGFNKDNLIPRRVISLHPEILSHFIYNYLTQIEKTWSANVVDIFNKTLKNNNWFGIEQEIENVLKYTFS